MLSIPKAILGLLYAARATMVTISNLWGGFLTFLANFFQQNPRILGQNTPLMGKKMFKIPKKANGPAHGKCATGHWTAFMP